MERRPDGMYSTTPFHMLPTGYCSENNAVGEEPRRDRGKPAALGSPEQLCTAGGGRATLFTAGGGRAELLS